MGKITVNKKDSSNVCDAVIISYNVSYGNDPQPLYEAGTSSISCVVEMEAMAQVAIQKAIFSDAQAGEDLSNVELARVPALTLDSAVVKYNFSASSGQAYVVESLTVVGKKA